MAWKLSRNRGVDFKKAGLAKYTPSATVCLGGGPRLGPSGPSPTGVVWAGPYLVSPDNIITVVPPYTADLGTDEKASVFGNRR